MASAAMQQIPSVRFHQAEKFGYGTPEEILVERENTTFHSFGTGEWKHLGSMLESTVVNLKAKGHARRSEH